MRGVVGVRRSRSIRGAVLFSARYPRRGAGMTEIILRGGGVEPLRRAVVMSRCARGAGGRLGSCLRRNDGGAQV